MSQYYYFNEGDGEKVSGPFSTEELPDLIKKGIIRPTTQICIAGTENWHPLSSIPELSRAQDEALIPSSPNEEPTEIDLEAIKEAGTDALPIVTEKEAEEEPDEEAGDGKKKKRIRSEIAAIGRELDRLWEVQRDSILARIKDGPIEIESIAIKKRSKEIYNLIAEQAHQYWRRKKVFEKWIEKLTKHETSRRLRGTDNQEKYNDAKEWLLKAKLWDNPGSYAFMCGNEYLYAGQASDSLALRLTDHFKNTLRFNKATHLRIIIPQTKKWVGKVERLLILAYKPQENRMPGDVGNNDADNRLQFIDEEITSLVKDTPLPPR